MELKKSIFDNEPSLISYEGENVRINFDVEQKEQSVGTASNDNDVSTKMVYEAYVVRIPQPIDRDNIVNAIISAAYPQDKMQAIINNHTLDEEDDESYEEHLTEWKEMQEWRKKAKDVAKSVMSEYLKNL